jgi:hypothetical protein
MTAETVFICDKRGDVLELTTIFRDEQGVFGSIVGQSPDTRYYAPKSEILTGDEIAKHQRRLLINRIKDHLEGWHPVSTAKLQQVLAILESAE